MLILGIETSCDECAAAVLEEQKVLANIVASQSVHKEFGGVVPELASRSHVESIESVVKEALKKAGREVEEVDAVAVTAGPGLAGSLIVGVSFAKALSLSLGKKLVGVNHLQAHICAVALTESVHFPALALLVSGGHTELVHLEGWCAYKCVGKTLDDAAGELLDKVGKFLGLPFPAGPQLEEYAREGTPSIPFPSPHPQSANFSFSGLKTAVIRFLKEEGRDCSIPDVAASLQKVVFENLVQKAIKAAKKMNVSTLVLCGGVASNLSLRSLFAEVAEAEGFHTALCAKEFCTDNAAMVASSAFFLLQKGSESDIYLDINPSLGVEDAA